VSKSRKKTAKFGLFVVIIPQLAMTNSLA